VSRCVEQNLNRLVSHYAGREAFLESALRAAAAFHDLGKLDDDNQAILYEGGSRGLPVNHVDAGTAHLLESDFVESAMLVYSHHLGLPSIPVERAKEEMFLRDEETVSITTQNLQGYLTRHTESGFVCDDLERGKGMSDWNMLTRRIALSCLVDGDHGDTARNYGREFFVETPEPRWEERLAALDRYVETLADDRHVAPKRVSLRQEIYKACRDAGTDVPLYSCDSPVGTGKTLAVMAHLLRVAAEKKLRHILVVLPFTNIITQSVDEYRKALVLAGEDPISIVAEHHHQVDFQSMSLRQLASLWRAPVIVTTAVQFFETMASNQPSRLRKLHELPGSAIFIDECHAAIPTFLWPQTWKWIKEFCEKWHCYFVLASGSLPRFWELKDIVPQSESIPDLVSAEVRAEAVRQERARVIPSRHEEVLNVEGLVSLVLSKPGPRLIIMNTVQSAAVIAQAIAAEVHREGQPINLLTSEILHLSTALAPIHREKIVDVVKNRLAAATESDSNFALVATSCVEAGVNFSFRSAFRERAGTSNLIQIGGRVRRHGEEFEPVLIDFKVEDDLINRNPAFDLARQVLETLFDDGHVEQDSPSDLVTEALRRELMSDTDQRHRRLLKCEMDGDYPGVAELYRVIASDTKLVVVDHETIRKLMKGEKLDPREIGRRSVQLWSAKIGKTCAYELDGYQGLYGWPEDAYDESFLGYMKGMLPLLRLEAQGFGLV
jgi:CRISPR-associated endonuclease/helicase Cas3